jgi:FtsP/CotA-like multicopper oxidase with cupredoxin domain
LPSTRPRWGILRHSAEFSATTSDGWTAYRLNLDGPNIVYRRLQMRTLTDASRFLVALVACCIIVAALIEGRAQQPATEAAPSGGWNLTVPQTPQDLNPDPRILEINLIAEVAQVEVSPGLRVEAWTYNGAIPGPLIRLTVGDRLIVHFTNRLPSPTTVHWHGLRVPIQMDGVPGASQPPVETGSTFTYDFVVPDAGLYWYHPHVMSAAQVGFGLYGAFLVDDPSETFDVGEQRVIVLSDIDITERGTLEDPQSGGSTGMAFGREGNTLLINGRKHPRVVMRSGVTERWRVVNAAKSRFFDLEPGAGMSFTKIGDDSGLQEYSEQLDSLVLAPGERADVFYTATARPGTEYAIHARLFNRGYGSVEARVGEDILGIVMADSPAVAPVPHSRITRAIEPIAQEGATPIAIEFGIEQSTVDKTFNYTINGKPLDRIPPIRATVGETQIWTVTNTTAWSHPLHLHGFFFQVLDKDGKPRRPLQWKDTVSVPFKDRLSLIVRFDDRPGSWMYHCHVLDHAEGGLMSVVQLSRPGEPPAPLPSAHTHHVPSASGR